MSCPSWNKMHLFLSLFMIIIIYWFVRDQCTLPILAPKCSHCLVYHTHISGTHLQMLLFWGTNQIRVKNPNFFSFVVSSPALTQLLILCLEHVELLGEAHDDHEEQQDHQSRGAHGQTHHLELSNHRLATGTLVPDVILDVASEADKEVSEDRLREKLSQVELRI